MIMRLISKDGLRTVNIGGGDVWKAVYSTVVSCIGSKRKKYPLAFDFLETGKCAGDQGYNVARQINQLRDELSQFPPERAVYDIDNPGLPVPWKENLSPVVTSCANYFTTADGQDLLYEIVSILCYARIAKTSIEIE